MNKWMKRFLSGLIATTVCCLFSSYDHANGSSTHESAQLQWLDSFASAQEESKSKSKPILILFTGGQWCPACVKLEKEVLSKPEFLDGVKDKFVFLKANFPTYDESAIKSSPYYSLMEKYSVSVFPTLIVVDSEGKHLFTISYKAATAQTYATELSTKLDFHYSNIAQRE